MITRILLVILCALGYIGFAQETENTQEEEQPPPLFNLQVPDTLMTFDAVDWREQFSPRRLKLMADPLTPAKATFLSSIVPGLGQIYLGKYLWAPIIWAGIGASVYYYIDNSKEYNRFRDIYKRRLAGYTDDEYSVLIPDDSQILRGMEFYEEFRDISAIFIAVTYVLNVIHANVAAHMLQFNIDENLTFTSDILMDPLHTGLTVSIEF